MLRTTSAIYLLSSKSSSYSSIRLTVLSCEPQRDWFHQVPSDDGGMAMRLFTLQFGHLDKAYIEYFELYHRDFVDYLKLILCVTSALLVKVKCKLSTLSYPGYNASSNAGQIQTADALHMTEWTIDSGSTSSPLNGVPLGEH